MVAYQPTPSTIEDTLININGELISGDEAHVSVLDRNFLYGDGVFDGMPIYDGKAVLFDRHVDRFYRSIQAAKIDMPLSKEEWKERTLQTLEASELKNGAVRFIATRGIGPAGIANTNQIEGPTLVIIPQRIPSEEIPDGEISVEKARIVSTRVFSPDSIDPGIKSCNYLNNALAERELVGTDADFGIMLDQEGKVAEAYDANIFIRDRTGTFKTPPLVSALGGMTREVFMEIAGDHDVRVEVTDLTPHDLFTAEDTFMTSSGRWISYVGELDGREVGGGEPSGELVELTRAFYEYIHTEEYLQIDT